MKTVRVGLVEPGLVNRIMHLAYGDPSTSSSQALADIFSVFIDVMVEMLNYNEYVPTPTHLHVLFTIQFSDSQQSMLYFILLRMISVLYGKPLAPPMCTFSKQFFIY